MVRWFQHPAVLVFLCFSLIGTPVTYRGGASNPHPHMFLEFLLEARDGHLDHHHHGGADEPEEAEHFEHEDAQEAPMSQIATVGDHFGVSISAFVVSDVGVTASILPQRAPSDVGDPATTLYRFDRTATGITIAPIAPPPR